MADDQLNPHGAHGDDATLQPTVQRARRDLIEALAGAAGDGLGASPEVVKPGQAGFTVQLSCNGRPLPVDGQDTTQLAADALPAFLDAQQARVQDGAFDDALQAALAGEGPAKVSVKVRAVGADDHHG